MRLLERSTPVFVLTLLLLVACAAYADTVTVQFTGGDGSNTAFGYYLSPYYGTINGNPVTLYCDDFADEVFAGEIWPAYITPLSGTDLSLTLFGSLSDALTLYREAAWLTTQLVPGGAPQNADIQATIWQLFVPNAPTPSTDAWRKKADQETQQNFASSPSFHYNDYFILSDARTDFSSQPRVQEFIAHTPEPGSLVLLGTVCLFFVLLLGRRRPKPFDEQN